MMSDKILKVVDCVAANASKNAKIDLLRAALNGTSLDDTEAEIFENLLFMCYSKSHRFGVKFVEPQGSVSGTESVTGAVFWKALTSLSDRTLTGNAARSAIAELMATLDPASAELFRRVVHKDMRAGFSETTLNKIKPKWIADAPYMRCTLIKDVKLDAWEWGAGLFLQLKADGMYQRAVRAGDVITMESRSGEAMPIQTSPAFSEMYEHLMTVMPDAMAFDGELTIIGPDGNTLSRADGNGRLNSVRQGGELEAGYTIVYSTWDAVDQGLGDPQTYESRFEALRHFLSGSGKSKHVNVIETHVVTTKDEVRRIVRNWMAAGLEGGVLKRRLGMWKDGNSKDQIKLKLSAQIEVIVTGFKAGAKGKKNESTFGALEYETADGFLKGSVTGIPDKLRKEIDANREDWMGSIITVEANDITQGRDGGDFWALSHPRFIERRTDKTEADTLARAKDIFQDARCNFLNA